MAKTKETPKKGDFGWLKVVLTAVAAAIPVIIDSIGKKK